MGYINIKEKFIINLPNISRILMLVLIVLGIGVGSPYFFSLDNFLNVLNQSSLLLIISLAQTFVILSGGIDLSIGSIVGLTGCLGASIAILSGNDWIAITIALVVGTLLGLLNGFLISKINIPPFVVTYGMLMIGRGLTSGYMKFNVYYGLTDAYRYIGIGKIGMFPVLIIFAIFIFLIFFFVQKYTKFGRSIYYIGNNSKAAYISGIQVKKTILIIYMISGLLAGIGGFLYSARLNSADSALGSGIELESIAAVIIGGTSFIGASGSVSFTIIGALIVILLKNAMTLMGVNMFWQPFVIGLLIIVVVLIDKLVGRERLSK